MVINRKFLNTIFVAVSLREIIIPISKVYVDTNIYACYRMSSREPKWRGSQPARSATRSASQHRDFKGWR